VTGGRDVSSSSESPLPTTATQALERLGRLSLRDLSMESLLQTVAELGKAMTPGQPEVSVSLLLRGVPSTVASTGELATGLDESQYERGDGPCLHAARTGELTEVPDFRTEQRWPGYARRAVAAGCLSSLSVPLAIDEEEAVSGALNLYSRRDHVFDAQTREAATGLGPYAAVAAGNLHAVQSARSKAENLQLALESRAVIDQAKGVLVERYKLTPDQAFQLLAHVSMTSNRKVRDVAEQLVATGDLPGELPLPDGGRARRSRGPGRPQRGG
jgi:transcriptional regulator with GAF, ATPase, and Fis domain